MEDKKDKDIWTKLSDAASRAGEAIGGEVEKLKLSHDLSVVKGELRNVYAEIGHIIYKRYWDAGGDIDEKLLPKCKKIDELRHKAHELEEKRKLIKGISPTTDDEPKAAPDAAGRKEPPTASKPEETSEGKGSPEEGTRLEFMDDEEIPGFCPQCGYKVDLETGRFPKFCIRCGETLPTEW